VDKFGNKRGKNDMMDLLIFTTCGQTEYLEMALKSLNKRSNTFDILVIDDGSKEDIKAIVEGYGGIFKGKEKGRGLTHSWNMGYTFFKENNYERCVLSNDDVIFPGDIPSDLFHGLNKYLIVGPLSSPIGCGGQPVQNVERYISTKRKYTDVKWIQEQLQHLDSSFIDVTYINGFCFSFSRRIIPYEFSKDTLFNPANLNVGNEDELCRRILPPQIAVSTKSYVYHFKNVSFSLLKDRAMEIVNE
jgi:glycosyltransferase involved in cell wall biosynthesis